MAPPKRPVPRKVLAMDGGGVLSLLALTVIRRLEEKRPGFLKSADLFAGNSASGCNSLIFAGHADPAAGLDEAFALWDGRIDTFPTRLPRVIASILGLRCPLSNRNLAAAMRRFVGDKTLAELHHPVVIMSFNAKGVRGVWFPQHLCNFGVSEEHADQLSAVDAALCTAAFPMAFPSPYDGHVDGVLFANNPSLGALSEILRAERFEGANLQRVFRGGDLGERTRLGLGRELAAPQASEKLAHPLGEVKILSLGCGANPTNIERQNTQWGWQKWLLNPRKPLLLLQAFFDAGEMAISHYCQQILGSDGFLRVNPPLRQTKSVGRWNLGDRLREEAIQAGESVPLEPILEWLDRAGWFEEEAA